MLLKFCLPAMTSTFLFLIHFWKIELNLLLELVTKLCQHLYRVSHEMIPECILNGLKAGNEYEARFFSKMHNERQRATQLPIRKISK